MVDHLKAEINRESLRRAPPAMPRNRTIMTLATLLNQIRSESTPANLVTLLERAISLAEEEGKTQQWADLQGLLGESLIASASGAFDQPLITRILAAYNAALSVYGPETTPKIWFATQRNLASMHCLAAKAIVADHQKHVDAAIAAYTAALDRGHSANPELWLVTSQELVELLFHASRRRGRDTLSQAARVCNRAIATVAPDLNPQAWAAFHLELARAIAGGGGDSVEDQERSIAAAEAALGVLQFESNALLWALANLHLGGAYRTRRLGPQDENVERAVMCLNCALRVFTEQETPMQWSEAHYQRGLAYAFRVAGDRQHNQECAIESLQIAIRHIPAEHTTTMNVVLGEVLSQRLAGDPADNIDKSIAAFELALNTLTLEGEPTSWIRAARSLATNYLVRQNGNGAADLQKAIALFETIQTSLGASDSSPASCISLLNLALAYLQRSGGADAVDEAKADDCLERALTVPMREWDNPSAWSAAMLCRGRAHARRGNLDLAIADFTTILAMPDVPAVQIFTALVHQAIAYNRQGKPDLEIAAYAGALATPDMPAEETARALVNRGVAYGRLGRPALEIADYAAVLTMSCAPPEERARALLNRGIALGEQDNPELAVDDYSAVVAMVDAPDEIKAGALLNRGIIYGKQGKPDLAIADYTAVLALAGIAAGYRAKALLNRAGMRGRRGEQEMAIADYVEVGAMPDAPAELKSHAAVMRVFTAVDGRRPAPGHEPSALSLLGRNAIERRAWSAV